MTLLRVADQLTVDFDNEQQAVALSILRNSLKAPFKVMARNAGISADLALQEARSCEAFEGINFATGNKEDLLESGILDPAKVTRCALKNAISVSGTLLLTNHSIVET